MRRNAKAAFLLLAALPLIAATPTQTKPEDVGLSTERLQRIHETIQSHIDSHDISGAVTLVMRKGRIAHLEAHGYMDVDSKKPMTKDAIFRVWSMSKPITGASILMLWKKASSGLKIRCRSFIPQFKGMKVAVIQERSAAAAASARFATGADPVLHGPGD